VLYLLLAVRFGFGRFVFGVFVLGSWMVSVVVGRCAAPDCIVSFAPCFLRGYVSRADLAALVWALRGLCLRGITSVFEICIEPVPSYHSVLDVFAS